MGKIYCRAACAPPAGKRYPGSGAYKINVSAAQAVILAAGRGSRLRKDFPSACKPLINILGKPLLYYGVKEFYNFGIRKFTLVLSPDSEECVDILQRLLPDARFSAVFQKEPLGTAHALGRAEEFTGRGLFYMTYCDNVGHFRLSPMSGKFRKQPCLGCLQITSRPDNPSTARVLTKKGEVKRIYEKPETGVKGTKKLVPVFLFSPDIYRYLKKVNLSPRGEYEIADLVNGAIQQGRKILYLVNNSKRVNLNRLGDYEKCLRFLESQGRRE